MPVVLPGERACVCIQFSLTYAFCIPGGISQSYLTRPQGKYREALKLLGAFYIRNEKLGGNHQNTARILELLEGVGLQVRAREKTVELDTI